MALLPTDLPTGLVTGQFYFVSEDAVDADTDPDLTVVDGYVTFTCSASLLRMTSKQATIVPMEIKAKFNSSGQLVSVSDPTAGVRVPATDSPLINPKNFTWKVSFDLVQAVNRHSINIPPFDIQVPAGVTTDLTLAMPVATSPGVLTVAGPAGVKGDKGDTGAASTIPGPPGPPGTAATVTVTGTTTGAPGTQAVVTQGGTATARTLAFTIPQGAKGDKGDPGTAGITSVTYANLPPGMLIVVRWTGTAWPARPTSRTDLTVLWDGGPLDPAPAGMIDGDLRSATS